MHSDANKRIYNTDKNTFAFIQTWAEINWMVVQKSAELQFTFVSTQVENVYDQLQLLSNVKTFNYFPSSETAVSGAYSSKAVNITRKPATIRAAAKNKPVIQADKQFTIMSAPKIKPATRRKTRKKKS